MMDEPHKLLEKAERALRAAEILMREGDAEFASGRAYYAMLHAAQALLRGKGFQYRKHAGVHSSFGKHFAKAGIINPKFHRWLLDAYDQRLHGDYEFEPAVDAETARTMIQQAREFLQEARRFLETRS
jgi:uncharacterized protein (UPF0332 family)